VGLTTASLGLCPYALRTSLGWPLEVLIVQFLDACQRPVMRYRAGDADLSRPSA